MVEAIQAISSQKIFFSSQPRHSLFYLTAPPTTTSSNLRIRCNATAGSAAAEGETKKQRKRNVFGIESLTTWLLKQEQSGNIDAELTIVLSSISLACKQIASLLQRSSIINLTGAQGSVNVQGEDQKKLDVISNEVFCNCLRSTGRTGIIASEEEDVPVAVEETYSGNYIVVFDPIDGSANIDTSLTTGSIFGIYGPDEQCLVNYDDDESTVYFPSVNETRKLKNGSLSVKSKALYPGSVFLRCVLNTEIHDFVREYRGVGGFVANKVGNTKMQINKPKPFPAVEMEAIFRQEKEEQEKADEAFKEEQQREETLNPEKMNLVHTDCRLTSGESTEPIIESKPKRRSRKSSRPVGDQLTKEGDKLLRPGSTVRVVSGTFTDFAGVLEKLDHKTKRATVGLALFGKQTLVDLDVNEIVLETK